MPDEEFLMWVCTNGSRNKFWTYEIQGSAVTTRYGRLGLTGQSSTKTLNSTYEAGSFAQNKVWEKQRKGYKQVPEEEFNLLRLQAEILGSGNKAEGAYIVQHSSRKNQMSEVKEKVLYDPNFEPNILLVVRLRTKSGATDPIAILFTAADKYHVLEGLRHCFSGRRPIHAPKTLGDTTRRTWVYSNKSNVNNYPKLARLMEKAKEVVGTIL